MFENEKIHIGINKNLILKDQDRFWMVTSGSVDIFWVALDKEGSYKSNLNFLYTAQKGELIFSLLTGEPETDIRLIAVSTEARVIAINKNRLLQVDHTFLQFHIEKWLIKTTHAVQDIHAPRVFTALDKLKDIQLTKNEIAYPHKGVAWCRVEKGSIAAYGDTTDQPLKLPFKNTIPVTASLYVTALEKETNLKIFTTREVLKDEILFMLSLNQVQEHLFKKLQHRIAAQIKGQETKILNKIQSEKEKLNNSLGKLGDIVNKKVKNKALNTTHSSSTLQNKLHTACQYIGDQAGFNFEYPKNETQKESNTTNQLFALAQASKVRTRKIILRGIWWKEENGHLLAFLKETKEPVALLQKDATHYILKNPETGKETPVTQEVAATLDPISYMFFYGFSETITSVKKLYHFAIQGIKRDSKFLLIAAFAGSVIGLLVPILSGVLFDDVIPTADRSLLMEVFIIMMVIGLVTAGLQLIQGVLQLRVETKSSINLQAGVIDHLLRLPVSFYKKYTAGDLTNRALSINAIRQILSNTVMTAVLSGAFSFVNLILLFYYQSSLAWIGVGLAVLAVAFISTIGYLKLKYDRDISESQGELQGFLFEFLSGITKIRITGGEKRIFSLWAERFARLKQLGFSSGSYQNHVEIFNSSYPLFTNIFFFSFLFYTIKTASPGAAVITVGAFMAFISAFNQFLGDCLKMSMALISSLNVITLYERVQPILEEIPESSVGSLDPGELAGEIEINSVSFRYHEEQPLVLKDVSFRIQPGEMVAFVGTSGSGKSTIMRLLLGFEEPETGAVYYDGHAFEKMNKDLVRRQIGVVLQNGALMSGSIYKNIVGNSELTLEDAWEAARMAGMEEDIKQMPMEMHTVISEGAGTFSGGQRQRLMIARAIAHKPRLLFMDEATSALDNRTQNIVSESLDKLQATRIVIAHRLSTVVNADRIFVLDKGMIVESGTYNELLEMDGVFTTLAKRQMV
ncbi:NHLP bacteriocin export ABC transporter permease/ATPase subunit [Aquimarina sp. ERC-38]|uniref:NHLP bacteriocin export ABC transporter permease/ATPase subunit n=1 Tax=Aquimarina sp. ERC-38 TaxID=2949996 RepID=UPI0022464965|nr:NHLP bacteriocin export ABC transporter permease/ATPase subunit [Aquimarina sp. ERC-38]UZO82169.1 NHLP bacteriocin export ABC transporter permease/ATPase subunit [Aquimarina sp. ERC-38]